MRRGTHLVIIITLLAALLRLFPMFWLHPLSRDEIEYFHATDWVRQGLVPYRDFFEHHTPLQWFVFAPVSALNGDETGVAAVMPLRAAQIPVWIITFLTLLVLMRRAGLSLFASCAAIALAVTSSLLMLPAIEYRVDTLACALFVAALALAFRMDAPHRRFAAYAGIAFCLSAWTNMRFVPLIAFAIVLFGFVDVDPDDRRWRFHPRVFWVIGGGFAALALGFAYLYFTGSLDDFFRHVYTDNVLSDRYGERPANLFLHRLLVPFGVTLIGPRRFNVAGIDAGGALLVTLGAIALAVALKRWRRPDVVFVFAMLELVNLGIVARMKFVYNYHLELAVLLAVPLIAALFESLDGRAIVAMLFVALAGAAFASLFRGKELDRAYQDFVMQEAHRRTPQGAQVFDGVGWAIRRKPAYRYWFTPDLVRQLVRHGHAEPYRITDPPAAVIVDHDTMLWLQMDTNAREYITRHYLPVWRNIWVPGLSARIAPPSNRAEWLVPEDGVYRIYASSALLRHPWFRAPVVAGTYERDDAARLTLRLEPASAPLQWSVDGQPVVATANALRLRKGQRVAATSSAAEPLGVLLVRGDDRVLFRQPVPGATLEGAAPRVTHVPELRPRVVGQ